MGQIAQKAAMFKRWAKIISGKTAFALEQGEGRAYEAHRISGYYNDLAGKVSSATLLDDNFHMRFPSLCLQRMKSMRHEVSYLRISF